MLGPAFGVNVARNGVMAYSAFVVTPVAYSALPLEHKGEISFFYFALGVNCFLGNVVAVTQQALWGHALERYATAQTISYRQLIQDGLKAEGRAAFITPAKWLSRVLMNAPTEGTLPWFYNRLLPLAEPRFLRATDSAYRLVFGGRARQ